MLPRPSSRLICLFIPFYIQRHQQHQHQQQQQQLLLVLLLVLLREQEAPVLVGPSWGPLSLSVVDLFAARRCCILFLRFLIPFSSSSRSFLETERICGVPGDPEREREGPVCCGAPKETSSVGLQFLKADPKEGRRQRAGEREIKTQRG